MEKLHMAGVLYVVATPIGNLEDVSRRGADVLGSVGMIAAEDTRRTRVLLDALGITDVPVLALHSHNESAATRNVLQRLADGADVALVSDAGTPLISDPGFELVRDCWAQGIEVRPVPGPSAVAAVLSVCPLPCAGGYRFDGFLPARSGQREARLRELLSAEVPTVFFEAPHRMAATLADLARLAPDRRIMIGREMSKRHEQYLCATAAELLARLTAEDRFRGEFVAVLEAAASGPALETRRTMEVLCREMAPAQAARLGAALLGAPRRELYDLAMTLKQE